MKLSSSRGIFSAVTIWLSGTGNAALISSAFTTSYWSSISTLRVHKQQQHRISRGSITESWISSSFCDRKLSTSDKVMPLSSYMPSGFMGQLSSSPSPTSLSAIGSGFLGQDTSDEDDTLSASSSGPIDESKFVQKLSKDERIENLKVMRQIFKHDLADLQRRRDYAGWVEARKELKKRQSDDPWFELNTKLKEAVQLGESDEEVLKIQRTIDKIGGPPPGIKSRRAYAVTSEIYDTGMSLGRAEAIAEMEQRKVNHAKWQAMIAEREANERREAELRENENPYLREEEEARKRREKTMKMIYGKVEEERKKKEQRAKEIQEKYGLDGDDLAPGGAGGTMGGLSPLDRAIEAAKKQLEEGAESKSELTSSSSSDGTIDETKSKSRGDKTAGGDGGGGGRPRIVGDKDITLGEITIPIKDTSVAKSNNVRVQVTSGYNSAQSDPPMRKHCFTYTIQITNLSKEDTIQLTSRKFEIQTVGAKLMDVVSGQGVTGRQPILKPGETFEYTSTAPLSVRPIGTTIVAARMKGQYEFNIVDVLDENSGGGGGSGTAVAGESNTAVKVKEEGKTCDLGMFHFIFPEDQRVKPVRRSDTEDDDDDDDDDDDNVSSSSSSSPSASSAPSASSQTSSASTGTLPSLPGDNDMRTGVLSIAPSDYSESVTDGVRVAVTSEYKRERSDPSKNRHVFSYSIRITYEPPFGGDGSSIKLVGRKFEIQSIGSSTKDVVSGRGVTGRYPVLKAGECFEYTSTAPLNVKPMANTAVVARMAGAYQYVKVKSGSGSESVALGGAATMGESPPTKAEEEDIKDAKLAAFHFILPAMDVASL